MEQHIGYIGLGSMGFGMASNLLNKGYRLSVFNRTADKAKSLIDRGAVLAETPADVARPGEVVLSCLSDDRALESVADESFIRAISPGGLHISLSTVSPVTSKKLAAAHARYGVGFVSAPVFGRPEASAAAKLFICLSGDAEQKRRAAPILESIGQKTFDFGAEVGASNVVKLAGNFLLTAATEAMAEASALAEKNGIPRADLLNMLNSTLFNCPIYNLYGQRIVAADFDKVGFSVPLILKDMHLAEAVASASHTPMPLLHLLCDRYTSAMAKGRANFDASVLAREVAESAGLKW